MLEISMGGGGIIYMEYSRRKQDMNRRINSTRRNYIIIGLCAILVIMGVGYAAFSSQLKISGTSNISSNWSVKITNIQSKVVSGAPTDSQSPSYTDTTATFKTRLTSPGDTMQYDVTVSNEGDIDAKLDKINVPESTNPAIGFEVSGIKEGALLEAKQSAILTVIVKYNNVTEQPSDLTADLEVTLDYSQAPDGYIPPVPSESIGGQDVELVESGDGLYEDIYEPGRSIYRGTNPNNYIEFNDELWRIIAKEADGTYKIIRNELLPQNAGYTTMAYDARNHRSTEKNTYCDDSFYGCGVFAAVSGTFKTPSGSKQGTVTEDSTIKQYLNDDYYVNDINSTAKGQMTLHSFNIGAVEYLDQSGPESDSISKNIAGEKMYTWTGNVGLANVSDLLRASTNSLCKSATDQLSRLMGSEASSRQSTCGSWMLSDLTDPTGYWTINAFGSESGSFPGYSGSTIAWYGAFGGGFAGFSGDRASNGGGYGARPVLYLKSNISLTGEGTKASPFKLS